MHKIYQQLSATLERALQANKHHIGKKSGLNQALFLFLGRNKSDSFGSIWEPSLNTSLFFLLCLCVPVCVLEAQQRLLLVTVFALSVHYQPADVSLAISTGLLNVLSQLCGTDTVLGQPLQLLPKSGISQLSTALKVASTRLLQILAITTG